MANVKQINLNNDVYNVVDEKNREMVATIESSATASKNYSSGDCLILNDGLYKVTSSIAKSGTIAVGTNVVRTTIEALLAEKQNAISIDSSPTQFSQNPVQSGGVFSSLSGKADGEGLSLSITEEGFLRVTYETE